MADFLRFFWSVSVLPVAHSVGLLLEEDTQLLRSGVLCNDLGQNGLTHRDAERVALAAEHLARQLERAQSPVNHAQNGERETVVPMEVNGYDGDFELLDEAAHGGLPLAVLDVELAGEFAHRPGRKEPQGMPLAHMAHGLADAPHTYGTFRRVIALQGIDSDEIGSHRADIVQDHIHHHLEILAVLPNEFDEHDAVEGSKGMVAHGDERPFGQIIQYLLTPYLHGDVQIVEQPLAEGHTGRVTVVVVNPVHLVNGQQA